MALRKQKPVYFLYTLSGRYVNGKPGGTTGFVFIPVPAVFLLRQVFCFFRHFKESDLMFLLTKSWRRAPKISYNILKHKNHKLFFITERQEI